MGPVRFGGQGGHFGEGPGGGNQILEQAKEERGPAYRSGGDSHRGPQKAESMLRRARENSDIVVSGARNYTDDILFDLQRYMREYIEIIDKNREELHVAYTPARTWGTSSRASPPLRTEPGKRSFTTRTASWTTTGNDGNPCQQKESRTCRCRIEQRHLHFRPRLRENLLRLRQGEQGGGIGAYPCQDAPQKLVAQIYGGTHGQECQRLGEDTQPAEGGGKRAEGGSQREREGKGGEGHTAAGHLQAAGEQSRACQRRDAQEGESVAKQGECAARAQRARTALKKTSVPPTRSMEAIPSPMAPARTVRGWEVFFSEDGTG